MDEEHRDIYNRFGYDSITFDPRKDEMKLISDISIIYIIWIILTYIITIPIETHTSRIWITIIGIIILAIDIAFLLTETILPSSLSSLSSSSIWLFQLSYLTEYELHLYIHSIYPLFIILCRILAEYLYIDTDSTSLAVLNQISTHQKVIIVVM